MNTSSLKTLLKSTARTGLCALALAGAMGASHATVVTFSTPIPVPNNFDGIYLNLATGTFNTTGASSAGWDFNPYNSGTALSFFWNSASSPGAGGVGVSPTGAYTVLTPGSTISAASSFSNGTAAANTVGFQPAGTYFLGVRFFNESTSSINYGYVSLTSAGTNGFPLTINGWSFENSGGAITIPAIPEPGTALMLSMGALALGAMRLRRGRSAG